ncbi:uncharacterized protein N7477_003567 [Penicillium maclennaniae]|uniref:uncharacterized protein n=1 Tax=Penicillium maclennaniae TaxID=1343394 RepID=UPI0025407944|nr:uncharacterized protein N7477_003567 [Penicillium maclennaniae]KAJ5677934.1 hypothetical protein N7477_003567 [Penicillium maclennaniae]
MRLIHLLCPVRGRVLRIKQLRHVLRHQQRPVVEEGRHVLHGLRNRPVRQLQTADGEDTWCERLDPITVSTSWGAKIWEPGVVMVVTSGEVKNGESRGRFPGAISTVVGAVGAVFEKSVSPGESRPVFQ